MSSRAPMLVQTPMFAFAVEEAAVAAAASVTPCGMAPKASEKTRLARLIVVEVKDIGLLKWCIEKRERLTGLLYEIESSKQR